MNATTPDDLGVRAKLLVDKHAAYIRSFSKIWENTDRIEFVATEHFWMSGMYWGLTAMDLLGRLHEMDQGAIINWVMSCQHPNGGFGGSHRNDPHLLYTLSAVQILALFDRLDQLDADKVMTYVCSLQQADGSFTGDEWGEVDTRFSYCALLCASILGRQHQLDVSAGVRFIAACKNFDGGFGCTPELARVNLTADEPQQESGDGHDEAQPGNESHAGQVFTCIGALALVDSLHLVDRDLFCWWLCERQTPSGGLNGRPEKLQDVCYSWWCLSCLSILGRLHWVDQKALTNFILYCQDEDDGGISDRPEDMADVYHTFFGIAGLSLMGYPGLKAINPTWALPEHVVQRILEEQSAKVAK